MDVETFRFAFAVWVGAANGSMPVENPGADPCLVDFETGASFLPF